MRSLRNLERLTRKALVQGSVQPRLRLPRPLIKKGYFHYQLRPSLTAILPPGQRAFVIEIGANIEFGQSDASMHHFECGMVKVNCGLVECAISLGTVRGVHPLGVMR